MNTENNTISYGDIVIDLGAIPHDSLRKLASKGLTHYLGNEQASKVTAKAKAYADENGEDADDATRAAWRDEFIAIAMDKLMSGAMGAVESRGPRGTSTDTVMREIAEKEIRDVLKQNKLTMPTGDKTIKLADGEFTRAQLIARRLERHGERLRGEAEAELRARERKAAKEAEAGLAAL